MKRITLLFCALIMGTMSFAQLTGCPIILDVQRNNGQNCAPGFNGANVFVTFIVAGTVCPATPPVAPTVTLTDNGAAIPASQVSAGIYQSCSVSGTNLVFVFKYCTEFNVSSSNTICANVTGCGGSTCESGGGPTPVTLSNFLAARSGNNVNMKWSTSTEVNSKEFVIQKKVGGNWIDYAVVPSQNRANGATYSYIDVNNISKGITEYRLKMVDFGGASKLSEIRPIKGLSGASDFTVYPNPSNGTAYVALSESFEKSTVQLMDNAGRLLKTETLQANGSTSFKNLTPGYYLIRVKNNVSGEVVTQKLSVIK